MALKGSLAVFTTVQLLNLINLSKRTGALTIFEGVPTGEKLTLGDGRTKIDKLAPGQQLASLNFREGKLTYAEMSGKDSHLASILQRAGKLNEEQTRLIRQRADSLKMNDKGLALSLINANYVTRKDILQSIQKHTVSIVFDLINWQKEPFEFIEGAPAPKSRIAVSIDLKPLIMRAVQEVQIQDKLIEEIPDLDMALQFAEDPNDPSIFKNVKLKANDWRVVSFINPKNSMRQIAKACNMTETEIRSIVYTLLQANLVRIVKPDVPVKGPKPIRSTPDRDVVNRLINKIKSIKTS